MITFAIDQVVPATDPLRSAAIPEVFQRLAGRPLLACSDVNTRKLVSTSVNAFGFSVFAAFAGHRPLVLTPDAVWLTIAQGFSHHVNHDSEALRRSLVDHDGKKELSCEVEQLLTPDDWTGVINDLGRLVDLHTKNGIADLLRCDFSTSTPVTRVASEIVLLEVFKDYFGYSCLSVCGIPEVTLRGTVGDWRSIEDRLRLLRRYDLSWWIDCLLPVCTELRRSVEGKPNLDFWQCTCMPQEVYGGTLITGWLTRFFPYLASSNHRNPALQGNFKVNHGLNEWKPSMAPPGSDAQADEIPENRRQWLCAGVGIEALPNGISQVPLSVETPDGATTKVELLAGHIGVTQDSETLALESHIGWGVVEPFREEEARGRPPWHRLRS